MPTLEQEEIIYLLKKKLSDFQKDGYIISMDMVEQAISEVRNEYVTTRTENTVD